MFTPKKWSEGTRALFSILHWKGILSLVDNYLYIAET